MKGKTHDLNHDLTFSAHTINCVCHSIRSMFRVLGIYNFDATLKILWTHCAQDKFVGITIIRSGGVKWGSKLNCDPVKDKHQHLNRQTNRQTNLQKGWYLFYLY